MKLVGFLLLVTIITLSPEVQELQASVIPLKLLGESRQNTVLFVFFLMRGPESWTSWPSVCRSGVGEK